jgi:hypothetical protein
MKRGLGVFFLLGGLLVACAEAGDPAQTVEDYLQARLAGDVDAMRGLSCAAWEGQVEIQAESFRSLRASLADMACAQSGTEGDFTLVTCEGRITIDYNGELRDFPLETYRLVQEDGEWKFCGEG